MPSSARRSSVAQRVREQKKLSEVAPTRVPGRFADQFPQVLRGTSELPLPEEISTNCFLVIARRFRCDAVLCGRQIFTERFAEGVLAPSARRTARLDCIVHHLGLALGGRPAAGFAKRLMLPVSKDALPRVVRTSPRQPV
jgi:hypothetical protein